MYSKFNDGLRGFFATVDTGIYSLIGTLYDIIVNLAESTLIKETSVSNITGKLYSFIGIFMLFKISFSIINYIINPDSIADKEKGGAKLIINVVITFALIILCPFAFDLLRDAQSAILDEHLLTRIILDDTNTYDTQELFISPLCDNSTKPHKRYSDTGEIIESTGEYIAMMTIRPFIQINSDIDDSNSEKVNSFLTGGYCSAGNIKELLRDSIIKEHISRGEKYYYVDYNYFISTIIGLIIVLIFAGFCLDAALRTIKLTFLEIIAPIPIISYIDPGSAKKGLFSKWLKEVGTTWADLFLRLVAIYFAVFLISKIEFSKTGDMRVTVLFILGALMFAKKLPDILKKMFNIDLSGNFTLNPLKKIEKEALGGKQITGAATGLASGALGMATSFRGNNIKERFANAGKGFKAGLTGGYKSPTSLKGLGAGMQPYREIRKKEKEEQREAEKKLQKFDKFNQKGRDLVKNILKTDENGNYILDEKGNYQIDEEKRSKLFENNKEYQDSFNRVNKAKSNLKDAKNEYQAAQSNLERLNSNPNATKEQLDAALKNVNAKREAVDKAQGALDGVKERHKIIQQKYTKDAEVESAVKEYLDRTSDRTLDSLGINTGNVNIQTSSSQVGNPPSTSQSANSNNYNGNLNYQNYSKIEEDIKNAEENKRKKLQEYYKETDQEKRNRISSDISKYEEQISELKNEREDMNNDHPEVAADYIENVVIPNKNNNVKQIQKEMDALYNTFKNPDVSVQNYGEDYPTNPDYQKAKAEYALKQEYLKAETSNIYSLGQRVNEFRQKANNLNTHQSAERQSENINNPQDDQTVEQLFESANESNNEHLENDTTNPNEEQEKLETQKRKEYLISELDKYRKEESEIKKHYGVLEYSKTREYKDIQAKIEEIEDELYHL